MIIPGLYRHWKGGYYRVPAYPCYALDVNDDDGRYVVTYESVPDDTTSLISRYVRTVEDFEAVISSHGIWDPNKGYGDLVKRFTLVKRDPCEHHLVTENNTRCVVCGRDTV